MSKVNLEFLVPSEDVDDFNKRVKDIWQVTPLKVTSPPVDGLHKDTALTVALIALVVSLPAAIENSLKLAERAALKEKIQRLIDWAKERRQKDPRRNITIKLPDGRCIYLPDADPAEIITIATRRKP